MTMRMKRYSNHLYMYYRTCYVGPEPRVLFGVCVCGECPLSISKLVNVVFWGVATLKVQFNVFLYLDLNGTLHIHLISTGDTYQACCTG